MSPRSPCRWPRAAGHRPAWRTACTASATPADRMQTTGRGDPETRETARRRRRVHALGTGIGQAITERGRQLPRCEPVRGRTLRAVGPRPGAKSHSAMRRLRRRTPRLRCVPSAPVNTSSSRFRFSARGRSSSTIEESTGTERRSYCARSPPYAWRAGPVTTREPAPCCRAPWRRTFSTPCPAPSPTATTASTPTPQTAPGHAPGATSAPRAPRQEAPCFSKGRPRRRRLRHLQRRKEPGPCRVRPQPDQPRRC